MVCDVERKKNLSQIPTVRSSWNTETRLVRFASCLEETEGEKKNNKLDECKVVGRQKERQKREQEKVNRRRKKKKEREKRKTRRKRNRRKYDQNLSGFKHPWFFFFFTVRVARKAIVSRTRAYEEARWNIGIHFPGFATKILSYINIYIYICACIFIEKKLDESLSSNRGPTHPMQPGL